jgi:hypothetical protein
VEGQRPKPQALEYPPQCNQKGTRPAPKLSHFVAFPSHFVAFPSHFVAFPSHFFAFPSHFVAFLFHPLQAITAYITCPYARFPVSRLSHFSHFPAALVPPSAGARRRAEKTKSEKRKMKIPLFLVFRFWVFGFSFSRTPHHVPKYT